MSEADKSDTQSLAEVSRILSEVQEQTNKVKANLSFLRKKSASMEKKINLGVEKNNEMIAKAQELGEDQKRLDDLISNQLETIKEKLKDLERFEQQLLEQEETMENLLKESGE